MRIHFIAIGGAAMHNLAIALHKKGYTVSGSDDEIFDPAKSRLQKYNLLPSTIGWDASKIDKNIDAIILGMHARIDNPELIKAKELGIRIYSFPEYLYEQTKNKTRVVIGGSHGKTTTTAIILHVLKYLQIEFDYLVGSQIDGFETMADFSDKSTVAVFEGDEYLTSPIDLRPKFHLYAPHIALITGIAWDHINVFPTFENYVEQFRIFADLIQPNGTLVYFSDDTHLKNIAAGCRNDIKTIAYNTHHHKIENNSTTLLHADGETPVHLFGRHNLQNISGALEVCRQLNISDKQFYTAISSFAGTAKRLQKIRENTHTTVFLDFAHSPSKLKATVDAVKNQFPGRQLVACMELHTFSSLNEDFLPLYKNSMDNAHVAYVYFNKHTIEHKKLKEITVEQVKEAFGNENIEVFTNSEELQNKLLQTNWENKNLLMMSSGNFSGINFMEFAEKILNA